MAYGAAADEGFAHRLHGNGGLHARVDPGGLERALKRQRVNHRGQHSHVVGGHPVHPLRRARKPTEDVAAADDHADLHARADDFGDFASDLGDVLHVDALPAVAAERRLAGDFQEDALVSAAGVRPRMS